MFVAICITVVLLPVLCVPVYQNCMCFPFFQGIVLEGAALRGEGMPQGR